MPIISEFYGIKIMMFWNDHYPPHFMRSMVRTRFDIESATVLKGIFPSKQLKLVLAWCEIHKHELMTNWENGKGNNQFIKINPLV